MKKLKHRWERWKEWQKLCRYRKITKVLILLGLKKDFWFENFMIGKE